MGRYCDILDIEITQTEIEFLTGSIDLGDNTSPLTNLYVWIYALRAKAY
jgi:hypothetical protein